MIDKLIGFSIHNKLVVGLLVLGIIGWGAYSFNQIPIDAVPDITNNQVQVITQTPTLAAQEVEQFVTFPIEIAMANLPDVVEIRSISRFGISVVTVVFDESTDIYRARQLIGEQLDVAVAEIPEGFGEPELAPITTGLGEVYQYVLHTAPGYDSVYSDMDLRTINDWIVKRQLAGTPGIIEVSGWGGHLKQYEVSVNPDLLNSMNITVADVFTALERNNENTGGSYIEKQYNTYFIRGEGLVSSISDIEKIVVKTVDDVPILIRDVGEVGFGSAPRYGAVTYDGQGEAVGGQALMLKGENSFEVVNAVKDRIEVIKETLPEGIELTPFLDRSELIGRAVNTVTENLVLGGLIVIFILILLLGNWRGGLIVATTIPLSMLVALGLMHVFGVSANLMSLGALDFGIIVDGAVIIVESVVFYMSTHFVRGKTISSQERDKIAHSSSSKMMRSAFFGQLIILIVFIPILTLVGIEGKMFRPMAQTVSFAMVGAIILSLTYVPMMSSWFMRQPKTEKKPFADKLVSRLSNWFDPVLRAALRLKWLTLGFAALLLLVSGIVYSRLGGEFIPTLEEGDFAIHQILPPGSSLEQSVEVSQLIQEILLDEFPEVDHVITKIGTAEVPTDPMPIEVGDVMVKMKPKDQWVSAATKEEMFEKMEEVLATIPGVQYEFTQPIQMRFNELIAGVRQDIAIKIFGEDPEVLFQIAKQAEGIIQGIDGVGDLRVEQTQGLPQMLVTYERNKVAQYGLNITDLNSVLRTAFAGEVAGVVFEGEKRFDLVVRLDEAHRQEIDHIRNLFVPLPNGDQIPLKEVATIEFVDGPMQISREDTKRRITIGVNARGRDIERLVEEISEELKKKLELPAGYYIDYGGTFENLKEAKNRLSIAVPVALGLIFILVFLALRSLKQTIMIYMSIPMAAIGGVMLLWLRDMPFSISAGVGFIVLSGVAVLNGLVLISSLNELKAEGVTDVRELIVKGVKRRIRPILLTASTDVLGFLPMALSNSAGAEVQRPLATVVIGGLITATLLTLVVLPVLYSVFDNMKFGRLRLKPAVVTGFLVLGLVFIDHSAHAQNEDTLTLEEAVELSKANHPSIRTAELVVEQEERLLKSAFDLDRTVITYSNGQLNSSIIDYQWQVSQNFKFPTTYIAQSKLQRENIELSNQALEISLLELEHNVRSAWSKLAFGQERLNVLTELVESYKEFANSAAKRYETGDINLLEKTSAESKYQQILLQYNQARSDILIYEAQLTQWLGTDSLNLTISPSLVKLTPVMVADDTVINPILNYYDQKIDVAMQSHKVELAGFLPDLSVGYFNQQIDGVRGMSGVQFGVGIPLFFWAQQGEVEAAKIGAQIAQAEYEDQLLTVLALHQSTSQEALKYYSQIEWYESDGLNMATELLRYADMAYQNGEIDYIEYISNTEQALTIQLDYLIALDAYNQSVLYLQYLNGGFTN